MHGARILPRTGDLPVRGPFGDAWSEKIATDCRLGTHHSEVLPRIAARERIAREYCHCQSAESALQARVTMLQPPEDASRAYAAMPDCPRTHRGRILPTKPHFQLRKSSGCSFPSRLTRAHPRDEAAPSAEGMRGREVEPSTAGDTGYGACCAARALMNPFTPTFPRYGAVIEIICYVTNN